MACVAPVLHQHLASRLRFLFVVEISDSQSGEAGCCRSGPSEVPGRLTGFPCLDYGFRFIYVADNHDTTHLRSVPGSSGRLLLAVSATEGSLAMLTLVFWMLDDEIDVGSFTS